MNNAMLVLGEAFLGRTPGFGMPIPGYWMPSAFSASSGCQCDLLSGDAI